MTSEDLDALATLLDLARGGDRDALALVGQAWGAINGEPRLLTQRELAAVLKVTTRTVRNLDLPVVRVASAPRYDLAAVRAALAGNPASPT